MKRILTAGLALGASLAVGACGSSSKTSTPAPPAPAAGGGGGAALALSADPGGQFKFDRQQLKAAAGPVTINFKNPAAVDHGVSIEGNGVSKEGKVIGKGQSSTLVLSLKAGSYTFYCPVPGHRQAGMLGTLTVN